jgi:hypothetical protein
MFTAQKTITFVAAVALSCASAGYAQDQTPMNMDMPMESAGWQFMQDGVMFALFNHQGGPRGGDEFKVPNWWMGMASRKFGSSQFTVNSMLSLDAATVGKRGYREIFQSGEVVDGRPLIDRQHPHDFFMQIAGIWRVPVGPHTGFTIAGGPVGEPAIGPVAFMHRPSAADNPFAPLSHHVFDSTHIAFGVVTAAVDHGPWVLEASLFNGREPDENRWDFDFGRLDSIAGRAWYKPNDQWEFQLSSARLKEPEALEHGDIVRTTASAAWFKKTGDNFSAVTAAYGQNNKEHGTQHSVLAEASRRAGANSLFGRMEAHQVETATLTLGPGSDALDRVVAFTIGGVREVLQWRGFEGGMGAGVTFYGVPEPLTRTHGDHPVSFQVFFRLRPPAPMGRMWNMRMSQPLSMSHETPPADPHAGHHMN